ncbi:MAG: glycoside hydrolase family 127 protein [Anaerolineae bacterium]|nr:glycoside hydrolase family 127 protein [Anaerolineae bacterium]
MNQSSLLQPVFRPLPLGAIQPQGWLTRQLRIQADGISGHLDEFWPDVKDSQWFGGSAEAWERAPYWLDGLLPLAYVLDDPALKAKVTRYLNYIIAHQQEDGWLGPRTMVAASGAQAQARYDLWGQILATKVLVQYHEASGDTRAVATLERALHAMDRTIDGRPLFDWGQMRWFEALIAIIWLYERTGEHWLLDLAVKLQAQGFGWRGFFLAPSGWPAAEPTRRGRWGHMSHVVNNAMAVKAPALEWRTRPTQGTELCAVVELAYSLEMLLSTFGEATIGDQLERVIFNALPATFSPDMWSHQYDQQANQVLCTSHERAWSNNGPDSNLFGVEPNYGCCTANLSQGWPKFAAHLWMTAHPGMTSADRPGIAAVAYAPSSVHTQVSDIPVTVTLKTEYPFRSDLAFTVETERPANFSLWLRIPNWAEGAALVLPDGAKEAPLPGTFHEVRRSWEGRESLELTLPMRPTLRRGHNDAAAIIRGPLVYALKIGERWNRVHADAPYREVPHADWEVLPTTPWNYALAVDEATLGDDVSFAEHPLGDWPFSPDGAPVTATVRGRRLPGWDLDHGSAGDAPQSPVSSTEPDEALTLIPYGCTNLRITEFPTLHR